MNGWMRYRQLVGELPAGAHRRAAEQLDRRLDALDSAPRRRAFAIASAIAAMLLVVWLAWPAATALRGVGALALTTGAATEEVELPADGRMWIEPYSRVELTIAGGGATVELLEGSVALAVHAAPGVRWIVRVDGHAVEAVGTRFRVRRTGAAPEVTVDEGVVVVRGPSLPPEGVSVRAEAIALAEPTAVPAARVPASAEQRASTATSGSKETAKTTQGRSPTIERRAAATAANDAPSESIATAPSVSAEPAWLIAFRADIERGDLRAASAHVPSSFPAGIDARPDLFLDAGDAFTAAGDVERADASYRAACRARPRATACGVATFRRALARARATDLAEAVALADDYLAHDPDGALAREAVGRRMEWNHALGHAAAARRDASSYVDRWPEGARVEVARRILAE